MPLGDEGIRVSRNRKGAARPAALVVLIILLWPLVLAFYLLKLAHRAFKNAGVTMLLAPVLLAAGVVGSYLWLQTFAGPLPKVNLPKLPDNSNQNQAEAPTPVPPTPIPTPAPVPSPEPDVLGAAAYRVDRIIDGDTVRVLADGKPATVRLIGIDTPETSDPRKPVQCFGREATEHLRGLIDNKTVELQADETQDNRDKYGRLLRYVFLGEMNINQRMLAAGYAYEYTYRDAYRYQTEFKAAEQAARDQSLGLWSPQTCDGKR